MAEPTYEDYKDRVDMRELLEYAGYHFSRRDGLRYPTYVMLDSNNRHVKGDKFIITANGKCCFKPPEQRNYNVISFIKEHPHLFPDYEAGMDKDRLVNVVCRRLLGQPLEIDRTAAGSSLSDIPFDMKDYEVVGYDRNDKENYLKFFPYFKARGIDLMTQAAFADDFFLSTNIRRKDGRRFTNIAFPFRTPKSSDIVGLEVRSTKYHDGTSFKGKALGTDSVNGLWIASPHKTPLDKASNILWFESAYDAMAFYQIMRKSIAEDRKLTKDELQEGMITSQEAKERFGELDRLLKRYNESVYLSTGGSPSEHQFKGVLKAAPEACHYLCFDNDKAGQMYSFNFVMHQSGRYFNSYASEDGTIAFIDRTKPVQCERHDFDPRHTSLEDFCRQMGLESPNVKRLSPSEGYKDWNDQLLDVRQEEEREEVSETEETEREHGYHR